MTCPNACRLRGLPQSVPREFYLILASNISLQNSHIKLLLASPRACRSHKTVVSALGRGIFLTQFVPASSRAFRLHRLAQNGCPDLGSQHFSLEFSRRIKMAFARCPCAFRLCRLTQDACPGPDAQSFSCKFLDMALVRQCVWIASGCPNFCLWHLSFAFSHKTALGRCPCAFRLRRLTMNAYPFLGPRVIWPKPLSEDLVEILVRSFWSHPLDEVLA